MGLINKIFAVIDPTSQNQRALNRAILGVKSTGAKLHVYCCIHSNLDTDNPEELQEVEKSRFQPWLETILEPARDEGIEYDIELDWSDDWRNAIGPASTRAESDLIIKNSHRRSDSKRSMLTSSDWSLFHSAKCPVALAKSERSSRSGKILLAVNMKQDEEGDTILENMVQFARAAEESYEKGELHTVSAFEDSDHYAHVTDLSRVTGVDSERCHVVGGLTERVIQETADKLDAELIIIGVSKTTRLQGILFGSTTQWLLNNVDRDIMVVPAKAVD